MAGKGARVVITASEAVATGIVFSMLADDAALRSVILDGGVLDALPAGAVHVNMATVSLTWRGTWQRATLTEGWATSRRPVLGRRDAAAAGKLEILAAGRA